MLWTLNDIGRVKSKVGTAAPAPTSSGPRALKVCADKAGRHVADWLCQGAAADNPYSWYYFDVGVPVSPLGSTLVGGSLIATNGVAYGAAEPGGGPTAPSPPQAGPDQPPPSETVVTRDASGAFVVDGEVNGHPLRFMVDTGASDVVLSPEDAASVGLDPATLKYDRLYQTANGVGRGAGFQAAEIRIGSIRISDVAASVNQAPMRYSLLGRTFLDRLSSFRVEHGRLYLR
jgi:clan AA aspartic protease (TIGR02281 family)